MLLGSQYAPGCYSRDSPGEVQMLDGPSGVIKCTEESVSAPDDMPMENKCSDGKGCIYYFLP